MNDINALAEGQLSDPHYLGSVTKLGDTRPIVADCDINSASGIKLVNAGMRIDSSLYDRLLQHKLVPPLDQSLSIDDAVTGEGLADKAMRMMQEDKRLALIEPVRWDGQPLPALLKQVPLNKAIAFKLTVMRETQAELFRHSLYVALVSAYIGIQLQMNRSQLASLATAALLHDIGILHIDPEMLVREHRMSETERRHLYAHSVTAWMILGACPEYSQEVRDAVLQHHERLDGSGYPRGLRDGEIGLFGQIVAVAEIVASRYGKEDGEHGNSRLETILKLNLRRYGRNLIHHLKVFYRDEAEAPPCSVEARQAAEEKMSRIATVFSAWDNAWDQCNAGDQVCAFINERMTDLKREIVDAGLNPDAADESLLGIQDDPRACFDARILLDETLWRFRTILQEIRRRWPSFDAESSISDFRIANEWMKIVEMLL